jgi:hypothetical protein
MAGYSARQATYTSGDTITAAHSNDEFNQLLAAFNASTGHTHDGTAGDGGPVTTLRDSDALNKILVDTSNNHLEFYVEVSSAAVQQLRIQDGAIVPITDNDIDLGTSSLEFKDLYVDGTAHVDAINFNGTAITSTAAELNILDGVTSTAAELNILDGVTSTAAELNILDGVTATAAELNIMDGVTSTTAELNILDGVTSTAAELNLVDGITAGTVSASKAVIVDSNKDLTGLRNLTISGDLTVSGDDITMGTNTAGNLLIADGTNFNSVAATSLSEISTIANDDVFLAVDTSGGGLKKVARSTVVSGLATSSAISNVVEDTTPQLGGNLDMNGADIVTTSNADLELAPNGTGHVTVKGNTNSGAIQFNCESNSHGQIVIAQPHSAGVTNTLTLPAGASSTLVSLVSTDTLTNKTLTSAVLNTGVSGSAILDEDNMASNSATKLATQQSIKAYVDSQVATADTLAELSDTTISSPSSGHILVYDGSDSFDNVAVSGDVTIAANGAVTIAATAVENSMLAGSIADSKLNTISTAGKVALTALEIDGGTDIGADLTTSDLIVVDDGAGGTNRKAALSRVVTLMTAQGFVTDDPTALAIALG